MASLNKNIRIILVETSHPANIGSAARAMKTMGLSDLVLVKPKKFPDFEATSLASGAADILEKALVVNSIEEALQGVELVFATSARERTFEFERVTPRQAANTIDRLKPKTTAVIFGRERNGLTNEELELAPFHIMIPTSSEYASLNLAQAVQVIAYEFMASLGETEFDPKDRELVTADEFEGCMNHLLNTLSQLQYFDPENPKKLPTRIRSMLHRMQLDKSEMNILRGVLGRVGQRCDAYDH